MKKGEKVEDMFERFSSIVNNLEALGKKMVEGDIISKILMSMGPEWDSKINAIQESKDTNKISYDELRGNLMTYEVTHLNKLGGGDERRRSHLRLVLPPRRKKPWR